MMDLAVGVAARMLLTSVLFLGALAFIPSDLIGKSPDWLQYLVALIILVACVVIFWSLLCLIWTPWPL